MRLAVVPFSIVHTAGMAALRLLWFSAIMGEAYSFPLTFDRLAYEFAKDVVTYGMLTPAWWRCATCSAHAGACGGACRTGAGDRRRPSRCPSASRCATRRQGGHGRGGRHRLDRGRRQLRRSSMSAARRFEIRSSLTKLEGELDPKRFVRVHKSYVVNIARIAEVTPWISGDWRIRLQDGAEVNLSRRYRQRFEALVPVRS